MLPIIRKIISVSFLLIASQTINAHEFWFEPLKFEIKPNEKIQAHEKVGVDFKGNEYAYLSTSYEFLNITEGDETRPVKSRIGDLPAINEKVTKEGLLILSAATTPSDITYEKSETFQSFIKTEGLDWVLAEHKKRGLPEKGFTESYRRFPKSLIKVGNGKGNDKELGLLIEWVLETNPYTTTDGSIKARLLWKGKPMPNKQISVFNRVFSSKDRIIANTKLLKTILRTDNQGKVEIPRANGGIFLINAVHMIEASEKVSKETGAVWESLWASLTYGN